MKILYVSTACYANNKEKVDKTARIKLEMSGIKFHNLIIDGLNKNGAEILSIIGLPVSIKTNKKLFWKEEKIKESNKKYMQLSFINIPIIKQIMIGINTFKVIKKWNKNNAKEQRTIIIDAAYVSIFPFLTRANKKNKCSMFFIFADIYSYMGEVSNKSFKIGFINNKVRKYVQKVYDNADGYIFLTEQMNDLINKENKPYLIMEGLVNSEYKSNTNHEKNEKNIIMYAGKLSEKFGLKNLVEGFQKAKIQNKELWIYGFGELEKYIEKISKEDNNIIFFGQVPNQEIITQEKKASLLVNPRFTSEEYTKYSFPSKNMEYMLSGTPVLTTKLKGIPYDEYGEYLYFIEDETPKGIKNKLEEIFQIDRKVLCKKGKQAQKFVLKNKNNIIQTERILKIIEDNIK